MQSQISKSATLFVSAASVPSGRDILKQSLVGVAVVEFRRYRHAEVRSRVPSAMWILQTDAGPAGGRGRRIAMMQGYRANLGVGEHHQFARLASQMNHQEVLDRLACDTTR